MDSAKLRLPAKYLPFDLYRVAAKIGELTPDALKSAANRVREAYRGAEPFQQVTALNHMANTMGFARFEGFKADYAGKLLRFMEEHGLRFRRDVLAKADVDAAIHLDYRQVADRLFSSGLPSPKAIFVGAEVEYWDILKAASARDDMKVVSVVWPNDPDLSFDESVEFDVDERVPPFSYAIRSLDGELLMSELCLFQNLIGNQLCDGGDGHVAQIYEPGGPVPAETHSRLARSADLLRSLLPLCPSGWVEVVPYNDRLCFLKAPDGGYEFVFRNLRSAPFTSELAGDCRLEKNTFELNEDDQFAVWQYFEYKGWEERDQHVAETAFYEGGGNLARYPGLDANLKSYLKRTRQFVPEKRTAAPAIGFSVGLCGERRMCFSDLVTVAEFRRFMEECQAYSRRRPRIPGIEAWEPVNHVDDAHLPAAVTWHDAKAYARWFGKENRLPVRLATEDEYLALATGLKRETPSRRDIADAFRQPLGYFLNPQGIPFDGGHPPYMQPDEFDRWAFRYDVQGVTWGKSEAGLRVLRSVWFGEWLQSKGAAINSLFLCSQSNVALADVVRVSAERGGFPATSIGKYKSMKIGFRLVYETDAEGSACA